MTDELLHRVLDVVDAADGPELLDVLVGGKEHTAVPFEGRWYLFAINFKFGYELDGEKNRGVPYLDGNTVREVERAWLDTLPVWDSKARA